MAKKKYSFDKLCAMSEEVFNDYMDKDTDRGVVLLAGDYLSHLLEALLRQVFVDDGTRKTKDMINNLFHESGALGSFAVRTRLAYLMGLIPTDAYQALDRIRDIRNEAAHSIEPFSLESPGLSEKCEQLTTWENYQKQAKEVDHPARKHFMFTFWWVAVEIMLRTGRRRRAQVGVEFRIPIDELPDDEEITDEELDFILNRDIKYRMGLNGGEEESEE